jgi:hypothetical protein
MNDLLAQAIAAHGGLDRWNKFHKITTTIVGGGGLWPMKGLDLDFSSPREMTVTLHEERASISPFGQPELRTAFTPDRIAIETTTGAEAVSGEGTLCHLPFDSVSPVHALERVEDEDAQPESPSSSSHQQRPELHS